MMIENKIDHTVLEKHATLEQIRDEVELAAKFGTNVCLPPMYVSVADEVFSEYGHDGEIVAVVGFPLGYNTNEVKKLEAEIADAKGATEIDITSNISALKSGQNERYKKDIEEIVNQDYENVHTVKVILETGLLTEEEKVKGAELCHEAGADFVKTCTGFIDDGVIAEDVDMLHDAVGDKVDVKASGGISSYEEAMMMIESGASRIGASSGIDIVREYQERQKEKEEQSQ